MALIPRLYSGIRVWTGPCNSGVIVVPFKMAGRFWRKFRYKTENHRESVQGHWEADLALCEGFGWNIWPDPEEALKLGLI